MKKLFTLIAAALMVANVNAKTALDVSTLYTAGTTTIDFSGSWDWKGVTLSSGSLVEDKDAGTTDDSGVTYFDASAYEYLIVKFSASTCDVNVIVQEKADGTIGQWGANYHQAQSLTSASSEGGYAYVKLDADYKAYINAVAFQNQSATGSITIEEVYWATAEDYAAVYDPMTSQVSEVSLSNWGSWGGETHTDNADGSVTVDYTSAWGGINKWYGGFDASEFDYVVVELNPAEITTQLIVQYSESIDGDNNVSAQAQPGETMIKVALDSRKNNISQIALQNAAAGQVTFTKCYFCTEAYLKSLEGESSVLWEGENNFGLEWAWDNTFAIPAEKFANLKEGDKIRFTFTEDTENASWWQFKLTDQAEESTVLTSNSAELNEWGCATMASGATEYTITLNASDLALLQATGMRVTGYAITVTKVEALSSTTGIQTIAAPAIKSTVLYNLAGQIVDSNFKGIVIKNGKKFMNK